MDHVLSKTKKEDVFSDPFPYLVIENAIDDKLCDRLIAEYPSVDTLTKGLNRESNKRFSFGTRDVRESNNVSPLWKEFIESHVSKEFFEKMMYLFGDHINKLYPEFEKTHGPLGSLKTGIRKIDRPENGKVILDAQICINTPVINEPDSVKISHVDNENKLFAGLFYLRLDSDNSSGGNLEIYKFKNDKFVFHGPRLIDEMFVDKIKTIPYKKGTLVMFLNSTKSLHGVSVRSKTGHPRLFVNFVGEVEPPLFNLAPHRKKSPLEFIRSIFLSSEY